MDTINKYLQSVSATRLEREKAIPIASIIVSTAILYASYKLCNVRTKNIKQGLTKAIPEPGFTYPYVGHMFSLGELPGETVAQWHAELGPIIKLRMGVQTWIMVDDPTVAHKIFVTHGAETSYRSYCIFAYNYSSMMGKGIAFSQPGHGLKENRSAALSVLAPKQIESYMGSIHKESQDLVSRLIESSQKEGATNPLKYFELNSMNVISLACFGRKFDAVDDPEFIDLSDMVETSIKYAGIENDLANFLPLVSVFDYFAGTQVKMKRFIKKHRDPMYLRLIKEAKVREGPNVVKSLKANGFDFTDDENIVFISDLIAGGTDTISMTLSWIVAIMCHHPEVQKCAFAEIDEFVKQNDRLPLFSERTQLPYCVSAIKECMRYKPTTAFGLPHTLHTDIEVDGYIIPKGATIVSSMNSMHRNPKIYTDPNTFYPERFMDNLKTMQSAANGKLEGRDHFNFGWGRRICPAIYLAEVEIFIAFVELLARCFIEPAASGMPDIGGAKNAGLTLMPIPYKVKFTKRADFLKCT